LVPITVLATVPVPVTVLVTILVTIFARSLPALPMLASSAYGSWLRFLACRTIGAKLDQPVLANDSTEK
jgi:uncharacterized membrane protein YdjX (TVP38/TMEM64 family)